MDKKFEKIKAFILKYYKIVFPILLIVLAAVTVVVALNARSAREKQLVEESQVSSETEETSVSAEDIPLVSSTDEEIVAFIENYYTAMGQGDTETLLASCDEISEQDLLYYTELSKYIDYYTGFEVYTKQGPEEGSVVAYIYFKMGIVNYDEVPGYETLYLCSREDGSYYIKNEDHFTDEEKQYIITLNEQVDVVEFNNRVAVEYSEMMSQNPELLEYLGILGVQVKADVGVILAERNQESESGETDTPSGEIPPVSEEGGETEPVTQYAKATATVNVRSSDSEKADKLGKVSKGSRVQVQEVRVNGWTKILFEGKDGYIKSEYLKLEETAASYETIGSVKANTNINIRSAAGETADRLGMLAAGESLELIAVEGDWCKVKYNGQVAYVKAEFVTQE